MLQKAALIGLKSCFDMSTNTFFFVPDWIIVELQCSLWDHLFRGYIMAFTASSSQSSSTSVLLYVLEYLP
jgi:hypothetical protein